MSRRPPIRIRDGLAAAGGESVLCDEWRAWESGRAVVSGGEMGGCMGMCGFGSGIAGRGCEGGLLD